MSKLNFCVLSIIIFISMTFSLSCFAKGNDEVVQQWKHVAENIYIDPDGIVGTEDIYGFSFLLKSFNKGQYEPMYGNDIWYTIAQYTIDCSKYSYKIGVIDSYGYENQFINGDYNSLAKFQPIVQGTAVSVVAQKLCRF